MRVLHVTSMFPPYMGGGVSSHVRDLAGALGKAGHDVWILTSRRNQPVNPMEASYAPDGTHVVYCQNFIGMGRAIGRLTRTMRFDIIHFHAFNALALAPLCIPDRPGIVFALHSDSANYIASVRGWAWDHLGYRAFRLYERVIARLPDVTIAVSERMEAHGRALGIRYIVRIPNAVDASYWKPSPNPSNGRPPTILVPRMHVPKNGLEYAADAMRTIAVSARGARMLFTGDGPLRPFLEAKAREVGPDRIRLLGLVSREQLRELYQQADIVLIPSVTTSGTQENTSIAALEAMATGKPVIATEIGGLPEVIHDGLDGVLIPERDSDAIAEAVIRLFSDPDRARAIGREARNRVLRDFTVSRWANRILRVYSGLVRQGNRLDVSEAR